MTENEISILIVEDEALIALSIKMQLESFGYKIAAVCHKYETALAAINQVYFDILLTDINLGHGIDDKSGMVLAQTLKQKRACPIIFLTAFSDKDTIKKAAAVTPSGYLVKPINAANLFATLQLAVDNFKQQESAEPNQETTPDYFFVKQGDHLVKVMWRNVYHMEYVKNYVKIKSTQSIGSFMVRGSLNQVLQNMLPENFQSSIIKINRSEAIAKNTIIKIGKDFVETTHGQYKITGDQKIEL